MEKRTLETFPHLNPDGSWGCYSRIPRK